MEPFPLVPFGIVSNMLFRITEIRSPMERLARRTTVRLQAVRLNLEPNILSAEINRLPTESELVNVVDRISFGIFVVTCEPRSSLCGIFAHKPSRRGVQESRPYVVQPRHQRATPSEQPHRLWIALVQAAKRLK